MCERARERMRENLRKRERESVCEREREKERPCVRKKLSEKRHREPNDFKGLVQSQLRKVIYKINYDWTACMRREMLTVTFYFYSKSNCQHLAAYTSGPVIISLVRKKERLRKRDIVCVRQRD